MPRVPPLVRLLCLGALGADGALLAWSWISLENLGASAGLAEIPYLALVYMALGAIPVAALAAWGAFTARGWPLHVAWVGHALVAAAAIALAWQEPDLAPAAVLAVVAAVLLVATAYRSLRAASGPELA